MARIPLPPYPNGWFAVAYADEIKPDEVKAVHILGRDFAVFRGEDGKARVLDAHCPHLGAHMGRGGQIVGNSIRCPFHAWCWDGDDGHCTEVPYAEKIPPKARVRVWPALEQNEIVYVYHHAEGKAPDWEPDVIPEVGHPNYRLVQRKQWTIKSHPQEVMENGVDFAHFHMLHGWKVARIHWEPEGPRYSLKIDVATDADEQAATAALATDVDSFNSGPGFLYTRVKGPMDGIAMNMLTPLDPERLLVQHAYYAHKRCDPAVVEGFFKAYEADWHLDFPIWEAKIHRLKPLLAEGDGDIPRFRKWYAQFYSETPAAAGA